MKKIEVIVILLFFLLVSMILAQEEIKLDQSAEKVDIDYEEGCEVLEEDGYKIYTFKKIDEDAVIDCSFIKIVRELYPNIKEGYLKLKGNEIVEADFISKDRIESAAYGFLVNGDFKKIAVGPNTRIVYKDGRLEVYGNVNDYDISYQDFLGSVNIKPLYHIEKNPETKVIIKDKISGYFDLDGILVEGDLGITKGRYILEGNAEFQDLSRVDNFILSKGAKAFNKFGIIEGVKDETYLFYDKDISSSVENGVSFFEMADPFNKEEQIVRAKTKGKLLIERNGIKIETGRKPDGSIDFDITEFPDFGFSSYRNRGLLLLETPFELTEVINGKEYFRKGYKYFYSNENKGNIFFSSLDSFSEDHPKKEEFLVGGSIINEEKIDKLKGYVIVRLDNEEGMGNEWVKKIDGEYVTDMSLKISEKDFRDSLVKLIPNLERFDNELYVINKKPGAGWSGKNMRIDYLSSEESKVLATRMKLEGGFSPLKGIFPGKVEAGAKEAKTEIFDQMKKNNFVNEFSNAFADYVYQGIIETKGDLWIISEEKEGKTYIALRDKDGNEIKLNLPNEFEGMYVSNIKEIIISNYF